MSLIIVLLVFVIDNRLSESIEKVEVAIKSEFTKEMTTVKKLTKHCL